MRSTASLDFRFFAAVVSLAMIAPTAGAASIPAYTVTDLGPDTGYTLSNMGANGTLTTSNGGVYAFPRTDNLVSNPQTIFDALPPLTNAPIHDDDTNGNPNFAYSYFSTRGVYLNHAGEFAGTDLVGVDSHGASSQSIVDTAIRQANGSFGPLTPLWSTPINYENSYPGSAIARVFDLNNAGQILGVDMGKNPFAETSGPDFFAYDLHSGIRTELAALLPVGWSIDTPIAIDDQGRILVAAESTSPNSEVEEVFLLTPAGLSSNPIPAPEPSTFAILAVVGLGLAIRRRWKS